jgi:hypothetical protein
MKKPAIKWQEPSQLHTHIHTKREEVEERKKKTAKLLILIKWQQLA